jgi:hypothetical protein
MRARGDIRPLIAAALTLAISLLGAAAATHAQGKPPLPPGAPTSGLAVVLFTIGIDYTRPEIARRIARDGEGVALAIDAVDGDARPFGTDAEQQRLAQLSPTLIIPIRIDPSRPDTLARAIDAMRRTPARIAVLPIAIFGAADAGAAMMRAAPDILFVVADVVPRLSTPRPDNVVVVDALGPRHVASPADARPAPDLLLAPSSAIRESPGSADQPPRDAAEASLLLAGQFACLASQLAVARTPADVRRILIGAARADRPATAPLLEVCRN